jgi:hypothetical protein
MAWEDSEYECTECCWFGNMDELEDSACPACGAKVTRVLDYDYSEAIA